MSALKGRVEALEKGRGCLNVGDLLDNLAGETLRDALPINPALQRFLQDLPRS